MSFFGKRSRGGAKGRHPQQQQGGGAGAGAGGEPLDFEETYRGYGDYGQEDGDYLNDETFGDNAELGNDFDFGHGVQQQEAVPQPPQQQPHVSYVQAAQSGIHTAQMDTSADLKPMASLWSTGPPAVQQPHILSMEEIERQQRQMQQQGFMQAPPPPPPIHPMTPQGYPVPPSDAPYQGFMQGPPPPPPATAPNAPTAPNMQQFAPNVQYGMPGQQGAYPPAFNQGAFPGMYQASSPAPVQPQGAPDRGELQSELQPQPQSQSQSQSPQPEREQRLASGQPAQLRTRLQQQQQQQRREPLSPEEQQRLQVRHAKVEKILKHAGLMTPRDKDFITRYQLSQIVTEDPYDEDFYFQVYKIIQRGGVVGESNKGLIARAYLEHSGHRLGGRYKRADIALQRMQNQVEKAVTVAKERPQKNKNKLEEEASGAGGREGVLGKVSTAMNSKTPRRQLQIPLANLRSNSEIEASELEASAKVPTPGALEEVTQSLDNVEISQKSRVRRRSSYAFSSVDHNSVLGRSGGRKFVLSLIETVYEEVLELEANLRSGKETNNQKLWDALHVNDDVYEVCPFVSMLTFDKGVKIMPRIFNFLDKQQKLKSLQMFFSELSHLNIIIISSYKTNPTPSDAQLKKIDLFQTVFLKIIVSFLSSSSNFIEIMGLLLHLIKNNNVSFISTSKIGLNLITVLISRAALIRQDTNRSNVLSSPEISTWNEIYDKLFTAMESKIVAVFPPAEYTDRVVHAAGSTAPTKYYDQAYIWQFLASLALSGKLNHQRIIIDEVRDEIFGTINAAEEMREQAKNTQGAPADDLLYRRDKLYQDLNLFLNVMGLIARDGEIAELK
ncbi:deadenylation-dependent mRNA-decapping factor PAT1 KNAG_0I02770 [Huiozyma naganishii CBS 8797]|uniref:mRNA decay factor PAT1 domain-containing protein n=1 Tax=Huiozyma naganishii (strain ATCC MYA-139 / BCRC 22969 / CBS 8797 / KCTC 17520 / NBRC 10181 / NCYC 3082 / Yp74L-3) TaxID=1071383 RepID=J7S2J7_HUIN7|nr:hypothetical protein KNAG_0I02770 [Kazachstania naganishii CBS 8797]CCK72062.1 hypothetical protein KNAG_0I02770 [Kazachstania naganishii CBS 8797]